MLGLLSLFTKDDYVVPGRRSNGAYKTNGETNQNKTEEELEEEALELQKKILVDKKYISQLLFDKSRLLPKPLDLVINEIRLLAEFQSEFLFRVEFHEYQKEVSIFLPSRSAAHCTDLQFESMIHILKQVGFSFDTVTRPKQKKYERQYTDYKIHYEHNNERNLKDFLEKE